MTVALKNLVVSFTTGYSNKEFKSLHNHKDLMYEDEDEQLLIFPDGDIAALDDHIRFHSHSGRMDRNYSLKERLQDQIYLPTDLLIVDYSHRQISLLNIEIIDRDCIYNHILLGFDQTLAIGSGRQFAYGVMDCGFDTIKAISIAKERDNRTCGEIETIDLLKYGKSKYDVILNKPIVD